MQAAKRRDLAPAQTRARFAALLYEQRAQLHAARHAHHLCRRSARRLHPTDGTRSRVTPHLSVVIGNKSSVVAGNDVFVGEDNGSVPLDDPNAPNNTRCTVLDSACHCY